MPKVYILTWSDMDGHGIVGVFDSPSAALTAKEADEKDYPNNQYSIDEYEVKEKRAERTDTA
jgi:hypothetical protein